MSIYKIILILLFVCKITSAQKVYKTINKYEKAVFTIITYGETNSRNDTATGFFINPSGIAIVPAHIFITNDSGVITLRNNKTYSVDKVISTHAMADLCLIKVIHSQNKSFDYIVPSLNTNAYQSETLVMCHPNDADNGLSFGQVTKVFQAPYIDRLVETSSNITHKSSGAPVINSRGDLIGISTKHNKKANTLFYSTHILNDSLWRKNNSDLPLRQYQSTSQMAVYMNSALINFMQKEWIESAKDFSRVLKLDSLNGKALMLRAESRRQYNNKHGRNLDLEKLKRTNTNTFLTDFFNAEYNRHNNNLKEAFVNYIACIEKHENYAPALIEFGLLAMRLHNDKQTAENCFNKAIATAPMYANGYYERGRFTFQHFDFYDRALKDINKAILLDPYLPGIYSIRGTLKMQIENYLGAIADYDIAIDIDGDDIYALFNRGIAYYNLGMKEQCCADWVKAEELGHYKATKFLSKYCNGITTSKN